ncbi:MAG: Dabb family protein [Bacteroidia bacterium]|nr:Dabb family protein [Bacteroidia bacterium]
MIKHIVFFNLAENAEGKSKAENAAYIKAELEALKNLIPEIITIEVGINHPVAPAGNFDISLYSEFASIADLDVYQVHPEHKRVAAYIGKVKTDRACVDYEV